jgi:hypothetical protein
MGKRGGLGRRPAGQAAVTFLSPSDAFFPESPLPNLNNATGIDAISINPVAVAAAVSRFNHARFDETRQDAQQRDRAASNLGQPLTNHAQRRSA